MTGHVDGGRAHVAFERKEWIAFHGGILTLMVTVVASAVGGAVSVTRHIDERFASMSVRQVRVETQVEALQVEVAHLRGRGRP